MMMNDLIYDPTNLTIRSSIANVNEISSSQQQQQKSDIEIWASRAESVNMHNQLLNIFIQTRLSNHHDIERTYKTNRGWWIVWMRVLSSKDQVYGDNDIGSGSGSVSASASASASVSASGHSYENDQNEQQEAFIIRRASDYIPPPISSQQHENSGVRFFRDLGGASVPSSSASPSAALSLGGLGFGGFSSWSRTKDLGPGRLVEGLGFDPRRYVDGLLGLNR